MDVQDLDDAATELYALTPAEFTGRRAELAAQARGAGQKELAKSITGLRRPTVSAWLVNQLARGAAGAEEEMDEVQALGADLRTAQAELDAPAMKACAKRRHDLIAALLQRAETVGDQEGQKVSAAARRELEETFGAAIADEQAGLAVTSGRLTRALVYAGFGEVDVTEATATPVSATQRHLRSTAPPSTPGRSTAHPGTSSSNSKDRSGQAKSPGRAATGATGRSTRTADPQAEAQATQERAEAAQEAAREKAVEAADIARADEAAAIDEFEAAERRRDDVRAQEVQLTEKLAELQREIVRVRHELDDLTRSSAAADREYQRRQRQVDQARKAVLHAERELDHLNDD